METTIGSRIGELIKASGKTPTAFARSLGRSHTSINTVLEGKSKPGFDFLEAVFKAYPQVNSDWILKGEGEMFKTSNSNPTRVDGYLQEHLKSLESRFMGLLEAKDRQIEGMQRTIDALLGKPEVVLAYAASCALFFMSFGYNFGYNLLAF